MWKFGEYWKIRDSDTESAKRLPNIYAFASLFFCLHIFPPFMIDFPKVPSLSWLFADSISFILLKESSSASCPQSVHKRQLGHIIIAIFHMKYNFQPWNVRTSRTISPRISFENRWISQAAPLLLLIKFRCLCRVRNPASRRFDKNLTNNDYNDAYRPQSPRPQNFWKRCNLWKI